MIGLSALCGYVLWLQSQVPIDEFRELSLGDGRWNAIVGSSTLLTFLGLPVCPWGYCDGFGLGWWLRNATPGLMVAYLLDP